MVQYRTGSLIKKYMILIPPCYMIRTIRVHSVGPQHLHHHRHSLRGTEYHSDRRRIFICRRIQVCGILSYRYIPTSNQRHWEKKKRAPRLQHLGVGMTQPPTYIQSLERAKIRRRQSGDHHLHIRHAVPYASQVANLR